MNQNALIIINPRCHQGKGWSRWLHIRKEVADVLEVPSTELVLEPGVQLDTALPQILHGGDYRYIISAGGDGSMHYLVNVLLTSCPTQAGHISIGAIGLGSSNDFLKPFNRKIKNIPTRIDLRSRVKRQDVGLAKYYDEKHVQRNRYFIVNASFGVTAVANWNFNHPGHILKFLKTNFTAAAIFYTAVTTILRHKNFECGLRYNNTKMALMASNINILKIPFVSGSFWYDQKIDPDDGKLGLYICRDMDRIDLLKILSQLEKGKFQMGTKTIHETITSFDLISNQPVVFECDGETSLTYEVSISVVQNAINLLSC